MNNCEYDCLVFSFLNDEKYFVGKSPHQCQAYCFVNNWETEGKQCYLVCHLTKIVQKIQVKVFDLFCIPGAYVGQVRIGIWSCDNCVTHLERLASFCNVDSIEMVCPGLAR